MEGEIRSVEGRVPGGQHYKDLNRPYNVAGPNRWAATASTVESLRAVQKLPTDDGKLRPTITADTYDLSSHRA